MCHISEETSHFSQNMCHISEETSHFSQNKYHISEETSHFSHKRSLTTQQQRAALESSNNLFGVIQSNSAQLRNQPFFKHQNTKFHALTRARTHAYGQELLLFFRHICHTETKALYFNRLHTHPTHINCHNRFATEWQQLLPLQSPLILLAHRWIHTLFFSIFFIAVTEVTAKNQ